jgi:serine/threonine protein kinase
MSEEAAAEKFAELAHDVGLIDRRRLELAWSELGTRDIPLDDYISFLLRKELLTQLQVDRLRKGERRGYFYGKYKVLYFLGKGSFARVYRAVHVDNGQVFALKVLRNTIKKHHFVDYKDIVEQFLREAGMMQNLRHVNIVPVYDVGTEHGQPFMAMEFVEGRNLREFLKVRKKMTVDEALRIAGDVASGLEFALSKGVTHRDLKPSNVLVTSTGRAKLVDFGLAGLVEETKSADKGTTSRSVDYAGLEKASNARKDDPRSDLYFAGCILYQMLTGVYPLRDVKTQSERMSPARFREAPPITDYEPHLPQPVVSLVNKAMELDLNKRFSKPAEMAAEVQSVQKRLQTGVTEETGDGGHHKLEREGENHAVMVVESNIEMQDALRDLLKRRGYRVLVIGDASRALARWEADDNKPAEVVIFCTTELGESALSAFNKFGAAEKTKDIPAILFVAEHHRPLADRAQTGPNRVLIPMPLKVRQLRSILLRLLSPHATLGTDEGMNEPAHPA